MFLQALATACNGVVSTKMRAVLVHTSLTLQNPQTNHAGQHFWPNLFLGRWLKGLAFQKSEK
jgi:hypothetical protein